MWWDGIHLQWLSMRVTNPGSKGSTEDTPTSPEITSKLRMGACFPVNPCYSHINMRLSEAAAGESLTSRIQRLKGLCQESFFSRCR